MSISDLTISKKLTLAFSVIVAVFLGVSIFVSWSLSSIKTANDLNDHTYEVIYQISTLEKSFSAEITGMRGYMIEPNMGSLGTYEDGVKAYDAALPEARRLIWVPELRTKLEEAAAAQQKWRGEIAEGELRLVKAGQLEEARKLDLSPAAEVRKTVRKALAEIQMAEKVLLKDRSSAAAHAMALAQWTLLIGAIIAVLSAIGIGVMLFRGIAKPIVTMTSAMKRLASGDHEAEVPAIGRNDEVGIMADAVQSFKLAAIEKLRLEAAAEQSRKKVEEERIRALALQAEFGRQQAAVVESLAEGLMKLSDGDLTYRLSDAFTADYEKIRADFNAAMAKLQDTIKIVAGNTQGIYSGTGEITQAADDLFRRTEQQAASLEETAAALDEITATIKKTAEGAADAQRVVTAAKANAERSSGVVNDAVAAMSEIEKSAQEISQIIGVIDEIAFQTNLLALNAGVEAARAGEAGKGFAVVASEVRALAQRSAEAAKEIKALILRSTQQVSSGVELVGETGKALSMIALQVGEITGIVGEIAASAREQATALHDVNTAVNQMDQMTQQNAAMVEESTAASHALAHEAGELSNVVSRFQVGLDAAPAAKHLVPRASAKSVANSRKAGRPSVRLDATNGNLALKEAPARDDWEEF
jgi:methyl-accepting chemotaxis protein